MTSPIFTDAGMPAFRRDAAAVSRRGQRNVVRNTRLTLGGSLLAAFGGLFSWNVSRYDLAAVLVALGFVIALIGQLLGYLHGPDRAWYAGRAAAESAKSLVWRFAVAAEPFPPSLPDGEAKALLQKRFAEIERMVSGLVPYDPTGVITPEMTASRAAPFETRRAAYLAGRNRDQQRWYGDNADRNRVRAKRWREVLMAIQLVAIALALVRVFGGWSVDLAGLAAALIGAGAAWTALKQYDSLANAYEIAAIELAEQERRLAAVGEADWPREVAEAEESISREHTLWLASRSRELPPSVG